MTTFGGAVKTAVSEGSSPGIVTDIANGPPSDAPIRSMMTTLNRIGRVDLGRSAAMTVSLPRPGRA